MDLRYLPPPRKSSADIVNGPSALEAQLPRLVEKLCIRWNEPEFEPYISHLLLDSRDGARQGLPWEVAEELLFLHEISIAKRAMVASAITGMPYRQVFRNMQINAEAFAQKPGMSWTDPNHSVDSRRTSRLHTQPRIQAKRVVHTAKPWWKKLLTA